MKHKNRKHLELKTEKDISTDTLKELVQIVLKNNIFNFNLKIYRQKRSATIGGNRYNICPTLHNFIYV